MLRIAKAVGSESTMADALCIVEANVADCAALLRETAEIRHRMRALMDLKARRSLH